MISTTYEVRDVVLGSEFAPNRVYVAGQGEPLVYLHGPFGQEWNGFLDTLAQSHTVYAPETPGAVNQADLQILDNFLDLVLYYDDLFSSLGLESFDLVGHSFGGMVAAEFAALLTNRVRRLVLIDPMGLWMDDHPVGDFVNGDPMALRNQMWGDASIEEAVTQARIQNGDGGAAVGDQTENLLHRFLTIAAAAKFCFPIPDRGLRKRLYRIKMPTLVIWGGEDGFVPLAYAEQFKRRLPNASLEIIDGAAHYPHVQHEAETSRRVVDFLSKSCK